MTTRRRGRADQEARARLTPIVASGLAICARCHTPILPTDEWDAGHVDDLALGGNPAGPVSPEHRRCNRRAGKDLRDAIARGRVNPTRTRLGEWLARFSRGRAVRDTLWPLFLPTNAAISHPARPAVISPAA